MSTGASFYDSEGQVRDEALHEQQAADAQMEQPTSTAAPDPMKQAADQTASQVKQTASNVANQAQQMAQSQAATQKDRAVNSLSAVGQAVTQVGQQLRQNNQAPIAQVADSAAANINQLAGYLRQRDIRHLLNDVEDVARRQPALFLGGAFVLGLLGARFLKSTGSAVSDTSGMRQRSGAGYPAGPGMRADASGGPRGGQSGLNRMPPPDTMPGIARGDGGAAARGDLPDPGNIPPQNPPSAGQTAH